MKDYQISKMFIALCYWNFSANSLSMITQFLYMSIYQNSIFLCRNVVTQNIDKFPIRYKEFYIKATTNKFRINHLREISTKCDEKKMKIIKYQSYYCSILL